MLQLVAGQNIPLDAFDLALELLGSPEAQIGAEATPFLFLAGADGRALRPEAVATLGRPSVDGIRLDSSRGRFVVQTARLAAAAEKVVLGLALDRDAPAGRHLGAYRGLGVTVTEDGTARPVAQFQPAGLETGLSALLLVELYRRQGAWKLRALGQGFRLGLDALGREFGLAFP